MEVVDATFPEDQKLAKSSKLRITLRNAGDETIPNVGRDRGRASTTARTTTPRWPTPSARGSPSNGVPVEIGGFPEAKDATPRGCDTAYVNTWACGPLEARAGEDLRAGR